MPASVTLHSAIVHHTANYMVRHAEQCKLNLEIKSLNFNLDKYKTSPSLWWTQREMLFPCRKHVAKVTEESECERGCDIPWIPGLLLLQTWSAALHPGSACKLLFTHANAAFCCSRHQNGVVFLLFAQASHQRTTQAILALSGPAVFVPHPPSHLWSLYQLCFHFFFSHSASAYI